MDPELYLAATTGNTTAILNLREKVDQLTGGNQTILHLACQCGEIECVRFILSHFPNLLLKLNSRNETALHLAANRGYSAVVEKLINAARCLPPSDVPENRITNVLSDAVNFIRQGNEHLDTALHEAVRNNHLDVVKVLTKADPDDMHAQNLNLQTPIYVAAIGGYKDIIKEICKNCRYATFDGPEGKTALHAGTIRRDTDCVKVILEKRRELLNLPDNEGWTALHYAAQHNAVSVLNVLVETERYLVSQENAMVDENRKTLNKIALHIAANEGHISMVMQLMRFYPDSCAVGDEDGRNILHIAVERSDIDMIQCILQDCPPEAILSLLHKKDIYGNTPLHLLVIHGCYVPELINHEGVDRNVLNNENYTPLDVIYLHDEIVADQLKIKKALEVEDAKFWNFWRRNNKPKLNRQGIDLPSWYIRPVETSEFSLLNLCWNFWRKNNTQEFNSRESLVEPSKRLRKDAKFRIAEAKIMKQEVELYRARTNTQIIVAALITTVTFTVGFTMPGGYHQDEEKSNQGLAVLSKKKAFDVFMVADTIALLLSTSSLFSYFIASMYQDPHEVSKLMAASTGLNIVLVVAMMLTFITGTYVVLPHSGLQLTVCAISCVFFLHVIFLLIKLIYDPIEKLNV